jgi:hypothetical protein
MNLLWQVTGFYTRMERWAYKRVGDDAGLLRVTGRV